MKLIFFSKCTKYYVDCKNAIKLYENVYGFWDYGVSTCLVNFSELWRECMWAAVNVLPNSPKISYLTEKGVFQPNLSWLIGNIGSKSRRGDFSSDYNPWTSWLSKGVLKREFSCIQVTMFLGVNKFRNI